MVLLISIIVLVVMVLISAGFIGVACTQNKQNPLKFGKL